jgi:ABC-2 type transport system ATP-binding protein
MWEEIARLRGQDRLTILLTTHYLDEADRLADRLAIVDKGQLVVEGTPEELKRSLRGDSVHVELAATQANGHVSKALAGLTEVRDVILDGRELHARADDGARAVPVVLQALEAHDVAVASVTVARPSLDDVYLRYTGRTFAKAEAAAAFEEKKA